MTAPRTIPAEFRLNGEPVKLVAADAGAKTPRCSMVLYSGKPFVGWGFNAILDLDGLEIATDQVMPILRQHDGAAIVGQSDKITKAGALEVHGDVYPELDAGREVLAASARGFRWQASFGVQPKVDGSAFEWVDRDEQKTVNGHTFTDGLIIRRSVLKEGSFVPLGADPNTSAIAAAAGDAQINLPPRRSKTTMGDATNPSATEKKGASYKDLKAAFPKHPEFAIEQFEAGATLADAKAAFADVLQAELAAKDAELAEAKKTPAQPAAAARPSPRQPIPVANAAPRAGGTGDGSAKARWEAAIKTEIDGGKTKTEAVRLVSQNDPELHDAYLAECNRGVTAADRGLRLPVRSV
ncbi:MAG TPA: hypothetical protein VEA38_12140 [Terriglobales bacterium]|nr:hypothetical protein [Terriglobales bacterium]